MKRQHCPEGLELLGIKRIAFFFFAQAAISIMKQNILILDIMKDIFDPIVNFKDICLYKQTLKEAVE